MKRIVLLLPLLAVAPAMAEEPIKASSTIEERVVQQLGRMDLAAIAAAAQTERMAAEIATLKTENQKLKDAQPKPPMTKP